MPPTMDPLEELIKPVDTVEEKWKLLPYFIKTRGVMKQHIDSFDNFCNIDIKNIVMAKSNQEIRSDHCDQVCYVPLRAHLRDRIRS